jgi:hypothetical protein
MIVAYCGAQRNIFAAMQHEPINDVVNLPM